MLENLIELVRQHAGDAIVNNPAIPNEQNDSVIASTAHSIEQSLQGLVSQGKLQDLLSLFHNGAGNTSTNATVQNISSELVQNLGNKFGLNQATASNIASNIIPNVLQQLVKKTNDPSDNSFNLQGIISHLTNGQGLNSLLGNLNTGEAGGLLNKLEGMFTKS